MHRKVWLHKFAGERLQDDFYKPESSSTRFKMCPKEMVNVEVQENKHLRRVEIKNLIYFILICAIPFLSTTAALHQSVNQELSKNPPKEAHFVEIEKDNVQRVAVGRSVKFRCTVENIGDHKIAWFHKDKRLLLAIDNKTVVWKERLHVSSQANSVFFLQIDSVQLGDKGHFTCQLNTQPVQSLVHVLDVVKSPQIIEEETTVNIEPVKEFSSVELKCVADGIPKPVIKWRRESQMHVMPAYGSEDTEEESREMALRESQNSVSNKTEDKVDVAKPTYPLSMSSSSNGEDNVQTSKGINLVGAQQFNRSSLSANINANKFFIAEGEILRFSRTNRYDMGFYMCIASNGVLPSVSQRIFLPVLFAASTRIIAKSNNSLRSGEKAENSIGKTSVGVSTKRRTNTNQSNGQANSVYNERNRHKQFKAARSSISQTSASSSSSQSKQISAFLWIVPTLLMVAKFNHYNVNKVCASLIVLLLNNGAAGIVNVSFIRGSKWRRRGATVG